ncbi:MAG TPA: MTAP family purine nucleoside phosphorylase, partial [Gaiellales bacterium]|nr:MTAP family purine nucleoside phosphorylase [Gaiellales bacterium]
LVNYRANLWAMREAGVRAVVAPFTCGSLQPDIEPGSFVVVDQFVDRTSGRADSFYDGPVTTHVSAADPYCSELRQVLLETGLAQGLDIRDGGTVVVIQGPRFSTRSESRWFSQMGWGVINMTAYPEGWLARELELCYANVSLITDYDVGLEDDVDLEPVSHESVVRVFTENNEKLRRLLFEAIPRIGAQPQDICATALQGARF